MDARSGRRVAGPGSAGPAWGANGPPPSRSGLRGGSPDSQLPEDDRARGVGRAARERAGIGVLGSGTERTGVVLRGGGHDGGTAGSDDSFRSRTSGTGQREQRRRGRNRGGLVLESERRLVLEGLGWWAAGAKGVPLNGRTQWAEQRDTSSPRTRDAAANGPAARCGRLRDLGRPVPRARTEDALPRVQLRRPGAAPVRPPPGVAPGRAPSRRRAHRQNPPRRPLRAQHPPPQPHWVRRVPPHAAQSSAAPRPRPRSRRRRRR